MQMNPDFMYPIGTYLTTEDGNNPSNKLGGTWELVRRTYGGELLAFGVANNNNNDSERTGYFKMSDELSTSNQILEDYSGQTVLEFQAGTFKVHTRGIVGLVKANAIVSGRSVGNVGFWWGTNGNTLPSGVTLSPSSRMPLLGGTATYQYCGCAMPYQYRVAPGTSDVEFYVNPTCGCYNGAFVPGDGGVGICLQVEVFAATGLHYIWKRTA